MKSHLVLVPCHAIWLGGSSIGEDSDEWALESFQKEGNDHLCFKEHVKWGMRQLQEEKEDSLLVFSGGQTKKRVGAMSESQSYYQLTRGLLEKQGSSEIISSLFDHITTEEFARDSFENVLFSLCRFYELVGRYPARITIVGFEFKRNRFLDLHLAALRFPSDRVNYVGNEPNPSHLTKEEKEKYFSDLSHSETKYAVDLFKKDPFGVMSPLADKRSNRDPFKRFHGYERSNSLLKSVLNVSNENIEQIGEITAELPWN